MGILLPYQKNCPFHILVNFSVTSWNPTVLRLFPQAITISAPPSSGNNRLKTLVHTISETPSVLWSLGWLEIHNTRPRENLQAKNGTSYYRLLCLWEE